MYLLTVNNKTSMIKLQSRFLAFQAARKPRLTIHDAQTIPGTRNYHHLDLHYILISLKKLWVAKQ